MLGGLFVWDYFPECFNAETGLTKFKIGSEYGVMVVLGGSLFLTYKKRNLIDPNVAWFLSGAILLTIVSEFFFTFYSSPFRSGEHELGISFQSGHLSSLFTPALIVESLDPTRRKSLPMGYAKRLNGMPGLSKTALDGILDCRYAGPASRS